MLGVDECDKAAARAQDQLGLVLEQHLDDLVRVTEEDGLLGDWTKKELAEECSN